MIPDEELEAVTLADLRAEEARKRASGRRRRSSSTTWFDSSGDEHDDGSPQQGVRRPAEEQEVNEVELGRTIRTSGSVTYRTSGSVSSKLMTDLLPVAVAI